MKSLKIASIISLTTFFGTGAIAQVANSAGGDWVCDAGPRLIAYTYPYGGTNYDRALVHLSPYSSPTPQGYTVTKDGLNKVTGNTGDGTPFTCTKAVAKKKK